jgi:hypothetical protein
MACFITRHTHNLFYLWDRRFFVTNKWEEQDDPDRNIKWRFLIALTFSSANLVMSMFSQLLTKTSCLFIFTFFFQESPTVARKANRSSRSTLSLRTSISKPKNFPIAWQSATLVVHRFRHSSLRDFMCADQNRILSPYVSGQVCVNVFDLGSQIPKGCLFSVTYIAWNPNKFTSHSVSPNETMGFLRYSLFFIMFAVSECFTKATEAALLWVEGRILSTELDKILYIRKILFLATLWLHIFTVLTTNRIITLRRHLWLW